MLNSYSLDEDLFFNMSPASWHTMLMNTVCLSASMCMMFVQTSRVVPTHFLEHPPRIHLVLSRTRCLKGVFSQAHDRKVPASAWLLVGLCAGASSALNAFGGHSTCKSRWLHSSHPHWTRWRPLSKSSPSGARWWISSSSPSPFPAPGSDRQWRSWTSSTQLSVEPSLWFAGFASEPRTESVGRWCIPSRMSTPLWHQLHT